MSWDVLFCAANESPPRLAQMPTDWCGDILGTDAEIRQIISSCFPDTDWSDPTWGRLATDGFSFEFNVGNNDRNTGMMVRVSGHGEAVAAILLLAQRAGWFALDVSQGEWLHHCENANAGWQQFQEFRDRVV